MAICLWSNYNGAIIHRAALIFDGSRKEPPMVRTRLWIAVVAAAGLAGAACHSKPPAAAPPAPPPVVPTQARTTPPPPPPARATNTSVPGPSQPSEDDLFRQM